MAALLQRIRARAASLPTFDIPFLLILLLLLSYGLIMLFSAGYAVALYRRGDAYTYIRPQLLFAALGYYPILKARFDAVRPGLLSRLCKLAFFNAAVLAAYAVLLFVLVSDTARAEFREMGKAMTAALLLGGNIVFLLYDFVLRRLRPLYVGRLQPVLRKLFR